MAPSDSTDSAPEMAPAPAGSSSGRQSTFQLAPYLFLLPTVGIMLLFSVFPMFYGFWMSLQKFDVVRATVKFVGLGNYLQLFHDPQFGLSVLNTAWYTFTVVPMIVAGSIAIAVFLRESRPARLLARVGFYIPFVLSPVVVATSWKWLLNEDLGVINGFLKWAGMSSVPWLSSDFSARVCVVLASVWNLVGFYMLMILAGLSQISPDLYEAARIEGANAWQRFWRITLPMLRPTMFFVLVTGVVSTAQVFDTVYALTGGGPGGRTDLVAHRIYAEAFGSAAIGRASVMAVVLFVILVGVTVVQHLYFRRRISYDLV